MKKGSSQISIENSLYIFPKHNLGLDIHFFYYSYSFNKKTTSCTAYWKAGERTNLQKGTKISVPLFLMIRLSSLNHFKMLQRILYRFHFFRCRMLPRLFQFFYRIRSIIHRQSQISLYLCDICGMYLEAVFRFYVLLNHFVGHFFFGLVRFGSFSNTIYRNLALALSKLHINVDIAVGFFVGQKYNRLNMAQYVLIDVSFREAIQTNIECSKISPFVCRNISTYSVAKKY